MGINIKDASHEEIFHMACVGELSLDQFKEWLDKIKDEEFENGFLQNGTRGQSNS